MRLTYTLLIITLCFYGLPASGNPLEFISNKGQWKAPFLYKANAQDGDIYLEQRGFTYVLSAGVNHALIEEYKHGKVREKPVLKFHAYRMLFDGCNEQALVTGAKEQSNYYNYFLGNNPQQWKSGIHPFLAVDYKGLYKGIDAHVTSQHGRMKYEFIVAPGADIHLIRLRYEGTDGLGTKAGKLLIATSAGTVEELKPYAYQYINGVKKEVRCSYRIEKNVVSYFFPDGYDAARSLVIDPTVVFATYTGSAADNWGFTATYDKAGNFYSGGISNDIGYPTTTGAFQSTFAGGSFFTGNEEFESDIVITKFNAAGTALIYSTYLGGSDNDQPHSMIVDTAGNLVVIGRTYSTDYPVTGSAYDGTYNGEADICISKLNATGTALLGSTFVGGTGDDVVNESALTFVGGFLKHNYGDDARSEVILDKAGNVYVATCTQSLDFPTANAAQSVYAGFQDGVVFKLNQNLSSLLWSTYLGGSDVDAGYALTLDTAETHIYVTGGTASFDFPVTAGALHTTYRGGDADGFVARYGNGGTYPLQKATYIGESNYDQCYGIQTDISNGIYLNGQTMSGDFPVTAGVYSNPGSSQFLMRVDTNLSTTVFSTVYGSGDSTATNISPVAFLVDSCKNIYISGWGGPLAAFGSSTFGMPITTNATQSTTDGADFYFIVFGPNAANLLYASYMGGPLSEEHVDGGTSRFDKHGVVYQAICGGCGGNSDFPTTNGSWSITNGSTNCNLAAVKIAFQFSNVDVSATATPGTKGCVPFTVQFNNTSSNATAYVWDFGDGTPTTTTASPTHTYNTAGNFTVRLIGNNPNACKQSDTLYIAMQVLNNVVNADFSFLKSDTCGSFRVQFTNTSVYSATAPTTFNWNFGDGNTYSGVNPPAHTYAAAGSYTVRLILIDTTACNAPDTVTKTIQVDGFNVHAAFNMPDSVCGLNAPFFTNLSTNAVSYLWKFGDGQTATATSPVHSYAGAGTYTVMLVAYNPGSCNGADSVQKTIIVKSEPVAAFSFAPLTPVPNEPIQFTNQSQNAASYSWDFGDGSPRSNSKNPSHLYNATGTYTVCLIAYSPEGCADTVCRPVSATVLPIADVPNAFSPNGDGHNDKLMVRGTAIVRVSFQVYNRWGQIVFETTDITKGWDGSFNGKQAPSEGYAYMLDVTFTDGKTLQKKGNVTLLR